MNPSAEHERPRDAAAQQTILIVDDSPQNLNLLGELLLPLCRVRAANPGARPASRRPT